MKIKITHLTKTIKKACVLQDVNMELESGHIYGFQGVNGSGKTMLFRAISGLIHPTEGSIAIDGKLLGQDISFPPDMGILLENPVFLHGYTGYDNLKMLASIRNKGIDIEGALLRAGLDPKDSRKFRKYSLGMKQRLGIACAIMEQPRLLIMDEPFNSLDQQGQTELAELLLILKEQGTLILLSSHDKTELEELSDEIYLVENGRFCKKRKEEITI